jgi:serine/threonine protein kinase/dienelactone hydrolase
MIGSTILHYRILEKLGEGGMGVVYLAEDTRLERKVAIKFLPQHISSDSEEKARFKIEAKAAAALNHPNIATVHSIEEADDQLFIVMEYVKGKELKDFIEPNKGLSLPINDIINYIIQIAEGLNAAHKADIIHRDIKSSNIMITEDGNVKIMDFGLAKLRGKTKLTKIGTTIGTIDYMSPEQAQGEEVDRRTDIWSFGIVLYEMLTGKMPFKGDYEQAVLYSILNEEPEPANVQNSEVSSELAHISAKALQKKPDSRYSDMSEIINELKQYRDKIRPEAENVLSLKMMVHRFRRPKVFIPVFSFLILITVAGWWFFNRESKIKWAEGELLPQIQNLVDHSWRDFTQAYKLEEEAEKYIPDNTELAELIAKSSLKLNINTDPEGSKVYIKQYNRPNDEWKYLGTTPIKQTRLPIGVFRWKFFKEGFDTAFAAASTWDINITKGSLLIPYNITRKLDKKGSIPKGMVRVAGAETNYGPVPDFFIDKYEVTNKQYKDFINAGGYKNAKYWKNEFIKDGKKLTRQQAMKLFVDQTGRPGPSTWQAGDYPDGKAAYPVTGISWYEAAAYAEFAGKELPTRTHWGLAIGNSTPLIKWPQLGGFAVFAPFSNFNHKGLIPVGSLPGFTAYGAYDMPGNAREWCWNRTPDGRLLRGGAWNDNTYMFRGLSQASTFDRSSRNGFRCAVYLNKENIPAQVFGMTQFVPNEYYTNQKPVSDEVFKVYKNQFLYDKTALNSKVISRDEVKNEWLHEEVSFNAAYNNERVLAHLFLPKNASPPYQTVIYFPGSAVSFQKSSKDIENYYEFTSFVSFIVKNGRAVLFPVLKGTFERSQKGLFPDLLISEGKLHQFTEYRIELVKDYMRCIDYLETRQDIDTGRLANYGMSWGGIFGGIIPAVEHRLKASVLISGGYVNMGLPEVNAINYLPRVKLPILMLNGKYDMIFPYDKAIKPMFDFLGSPKKDKELKLYNTDHIPPQNEFIKETLAWFDKYLGPVK